MTRIALIHALAYSVAPINDELVQAWPEAQRMNLLDDSLSADLAQRAQGLDGDMHRRFEMLADYAVGTGAQAILFTCSAFGPCIEAVARKHAGIPVLKPNESMVQEALKHGGRVGLIASFAPTFVSMPLEFPPEIELRCALAAGAMEALNRCDLAMHDVLVVGAAREFAAASCTVIALAQFSIARAAPAVRQVLGLSVLTTPGSAVRALRQRPAT